MEKTIEVKLIVKINDDEDIIAEVLLNIDKNFLNSTRDIYFAKYLKEITVQHAEAIIYSACRLAELHDELILNDENNEFLNGIDE